MGLSIRNGFVYDDVLAIVQNPRVTDPSLWHTIPGSSYWLGGLWRPLTIAGFAVQWWIGGGTPWVFHFVLLASYLGTGLLLYAFLRRLSIGAYPALAAVLLFLVHPVHVEVVANGVGQAELWSALAMLTAASIYLRARQTAVTGVAIGGLLVCVTLGVASKEQGFTIPLVLAGIEGLILANRGESPATRVRLLVPVTALTLLLLAVRAAILGGVKGETSAMALRGLGLGGRMTTFLAVVPEYARLLIWPAHLQADYGPPGIPVGGPLTPRHLIGVVLVAGTLALLAYTRRRNAAAALGLWWAIVTLGPVSNLLTATGLVMAERVLFLPSIGLAIALGAAVQARQAANGVTPRASDRVARAAGWQTLGFTTVLVVWGVGLTVRSATRVDTWRTQRQFYVALPRDAPLAYRAWKGAAEYWEGAGDHPRAIAMLRHALELWPRDYQVNERLGQFLRTDGQCAAAIPVLAAGVKLDPDVSSMRAKLIECAITERQWEIADRYAADAVELGQTEFLSVRMRVARQRTAAESTARPP